MNRRGMTLVEMMVATTMSLIILGIIAQLFGMLGNRRVEVVVQHSKGCLLRPSLRCYLRASSGAERAASYTSRCVH